MKNKQSARRQVSARLEREHASKYDVAAGVTPFTLTAPASKFAASISPQSDGDGVQLTPNLFIHSTSEPGLREGDEYTIQAKQSLTYPGNDIASIASQDHLNKTKKFSVLGSKSSLDASAIHSAYPPPGHSVYWNTLPHVLFNDPQTPWLYRPGAPADVNTQEPWLALFVFTDAELSIPLQSLKQLAEDVGRTDPSLPLMPAVDLSVAMTNKEFYSLAPHGTTPLGDVAPTSAWNDTMMKAIFVPTELFNASLTRPSAADDNPWLLSHVRTVSTSGMTDVDGLDDGTFAVTVSQRTGPPDITLDTLVHAHLIVVPGVDGTGSTKPMSFQRVGVCSLYSWSYTCLPRTGFSAEETMQKLGNSIQPLRLSDLALSRLPDDSRAPWLKDRLTRGFSIAKYRVISGEETMCMFRGPLIPENPYNGEYEPVELASSDVGSDLAIVDQESGLINITYQLAWTLGRSMAMSSRSFSAALMRIRGVIHQQSLAEAKIKLDSKSTVQVHQPIKSVVSRTPMFKDTLKGFAFGSATSNFANRWLKATTQPSSRAIYSFTRDDVKEMYRQTHRIMADKVASAATANPQVAPVAGFDETNPAASTDWATVLGWVLDRWFLEGIPVLHMLPDASSMPKESIRTFYLDPAWLTAFFDGALSVAEHYTDQDEVRDAMKGSVQRYLESNLGGKNHPPQLPRFGMLVRSELIKKYPNLQFSAPRNDASTGQHEILRAQTIDQDLLILLFDRVPGSGLFPQGVTITPPAHQLSFAIGGRGEIPTATSLTQTWGPVMLQNTDGTFTIEEPDPEHGKSTYNSTESESTPYGFSFKYHTLRPSHLLQDALTALGLSSTTSIDKSGGISSLLGSQLIEKYPILTIIDPELKSQVPGQPPSLILDRRGWTVKADSQELPSNPTSNVLDGDPQTFWHTEFIAKSPNYPHTLEIDMKRRYHVAGLKYTPRQDGSHNGMIQAFSISVGIGDLLTTVAAGSDWVADGTTKVVTFAPTVAQRIVLTAEREVNGNPWASAAEISIIAGSTALPVNSIQTARRAGYDQHQTSDGDAARPLVKTVPPTSPPRRLTSRAPAPVSKLLRALALVEVTSDLNFCFNSLRTFPVPKPQKTTGRQQAGLQTNVYNVRTHLKDPPLFKLIKTDIPNHTTDLYFDIRMDPAIAPQASKRFVSSVEVLIAFSRSDVKAPLAPFSVCGPESNSVSSTKLMGDYADAPAKNRVKGVKIPTIDFIGIGQRYTLKKQITSTGDFCVTLIPRVTSESGYNGPQTALSNSPDLSFVMRDVLLADMADFEVLKWSYNAFSISVHENYDVTEDGNSDFIFSKVYVPMYLMSVTDK